MGRGWAQHPGGLRPPPCAHRPQGLAPPCPDTPTTLYAHPAPTSEPCPGGSALHPYPPPCSPGCAHRPCSFCPGPPLGQAAPPHPPTACGPRGARHSGNGSTAAPGRTAAPCSRWGRGGGLAPPASRGGSLCARALMPPFPRSPQVLPSPPRLAGHCPRTPRGLHCRAARPPLATPTSPSSLPGEWGGGQDFYLGRGGQTEGLQAVMGGQ